MVFKTFGNHAFLNKLLRQALESPEARRLGLVSPLEAALEDPSQLAFRRLSGGDINEVYQLRLPGGASLLFKWHADPPPGFFAAETDGLAALRATQSLKVPQVLAFGENGLLMEWLESPSDQASRDRMAYGEALGRGLAQLHRATADSLGHPAAFGYPKDNFVGLLPQQNGWLSRWSEFYRDRRLMPQLKIAAQNGRLTGQRREWVDRLLARLSDWIDDRQVRPSLLHGDLWGGNWLPTTDGPAVIDPAVYFGDREMDLAMASLFGGFPDTFFQTYKEAFPLLPGYEERIPLYQLYYLLIHLNIFGESYGPSVDRILRRYGG